MCNIAGYVGNRPAAPILIEMMRRQEGFAGGYYTGIATIHEGKLYYAKLTGDTDRLVNLTEAANLPGTIGIIHSRSQAGGGDEWAHPFIACCNGVPSTAYVANGAAGFFQDRSEEYSRKAEGLLSDGYSMSSKVILDSDRYQNLSDGSTVHMSDVMCQQIQKNMDDGADPVAAMTGAFCEIPSEIVGLILTLSEPDSITWSRINMPMTVAFADHGAYLASTAMAIPDDVGEIKKLPACASGRVFSDHYTATPYTENPCNVAVMDARVRHDAYEKVLSMLNDGSVTYGDLTKQVKLLFDPSDCQPGGMLTYDILYSLKKQGKLKIEIATVDGAADGLTAPQFRLSLL